MVGIVLLGAVSGLVPTLADGSKLPLTTVIEIFMLVAAAAMILLTKLDSNKVLDQPVFRTGMFAVVLAFGLCWLVNTFIGDQSSFITDNMSALTNKYPWIFIVAVFIVGGDHNESVFDNNDHDSDRNRFRTSGKRNRGRLDRMFI